ncbi:MAG: YqeG family HAD IIIA-type phosphatase [Candidatus Velthaea sp.]
MSARRRWWWPTSYAPRISQVSFEDLAAAGVRGVIVDLDNTLVGYRKLTPDDEDAAWIVDAHERGLRVVMVTNNSTPWAAQVAENLKIPCIANARKPFPGGFRRALGVLELPHDAVVVVGDQLFTDVFGAKLCGLAVILVEPLVLRDPRNTRWLRSLERWLLRGLPRA